MLSIRNEGRLRLLAAATAGTPNTAKVWSAILPWSTTVGRSYVINDSGFTMFPHAPVGIPRLGDRAYPAAAAMVNLFLVSGRRPQLRGMPANRW